MCLLAFEGGRGGGGGSRKRERVEDEEGLVVGAEGGWRMVMAASGPEVQHKHRRSLSEMTIPATLLSPRAAAAPPIDFDGVLGVYPRAVPKAVAGVGVGGFSSPAKAVSAGRLLNVASPGAAASDAERLQSVRSLPEWNGIGGGDLNNKGPLECNLGTVGVKNGVKMGLTSLANGAVLCANGSGDKMTVGANGQNGRAPLRPLLIMRPASMATLEVISPRSRMWAEGNNVDRGAGGGGGGGGGYRIPLSPLALRREASGLARGVVGVRASVQLDLGALARSNCDAGGELSELEMRRDKMAFYEKQCSRVMDHVYLGSDVVARNRETLRAAGITHVLNCVGFVCTEYFAGDLKYKTLWLHDTPGEDILSVLYDVFDFFEGVRQSGGRVFVHCCQGVSRSTALVIAYLMWKEGRSYDDAFRDVKTARGVTNPNMGFACQLLQWQRRVLGGGGGAGAGGVQRLFRVTPHSHYDPLHLVHKPVPKPCRDSLDTRGAFLLLAPTGVFVWKGRECSCVLASAGEKAAKQLIKYEKVAGPIWFVKEGEESSEFWAALSVASSSAALTSMSVSSSDGGVGIAGTGIRVSAYDADYNAVGKARTSGHGSGGVAKAGPMRRGWNDSSVYSCAQESLQNDNHGLSPLKSAAERNYERIREQGRACSEGVDRGGGGMSIQEEEETSAMRRAVSCDSVPIEGEEQGSCTSSDPCAGGGMGRGKRAERREQERENGVKALRRACGGEPDSPTMSQRRSKEDSDIAMVDSDSSSGVVGHHRGGGEEGEGEGEGEGEDEAGRRESSGQMPQARAALVVETLPMRQLATKECVRGGLSGGEVAVEATVGSRPGEDNGACCAENGEVPRLFEWPSREELHVFDADDLQSQKVFVLWIPKAREAGDEGERSELLVWVGGECRCGSEIEERQCMEKEDGRERGSQAWERRWWRVGDQFRLWRRLSQKTRIRVVEEGKEPADFWACCSRR
ncbi:hypothetical protein CBR_g8320 [Chara braunii]|uniref:Protein-tyrosine-phosphatase n=1 Tax=Chara braunii TaxID=69332 RepID=A0A388KLV0_CHABU|nr:hypothetical protein CBR_g8320 [Chara braunii]|eukprot:GBG71022.1 hypothetical protein CBR_g8320 [Chara braunii]